MTPADKSRAVQHYQAMAAAAEAQARYPHAHIAALMDELIAEVERSLSWADDAAHDTLHHLRAARAMWEVTYEQEAHELEADIRWAGRKS